MKMPRRIDDALLKGAFEENFPDFLRFLYPNADEVFDFGKTIEFMNKELLAIVPDRVSGSGMRIVDLLAKVHLKDGTVKPILVHTEIEGGSKKAFAERMFEYYYRIRDRYGPPVETIAVFTGGRKQVRPSHFKEKCIDCVAKYRFRAYHIFQHSADELFAMDNAFGMIVLACQNSLDQGRVPEEELAQSRLDIAKALLGKNIDHDRIKSLLYFIKHFLFVGNEELNRKFDKEITQFSNKNIDMGVLEIIKDREREQGIIKGRKEEALAIANRLKAKGYTLDEIAEVSKLSVEEIEKL